MIAFDGICVHGRLRVSLSAAHTKEDVQQLAETIKECNLHFLPIDQVLGSSKSKSTAGPTQSRL